MALRRALAASLPERLAEALLEKLDMQGELANLPDNRRGCRTRQGIPAANVSVRELAQFKIGHENTLSVWMQTIIETRSNGVGLMTR